MTRQRHGNKTEQELILGKIVDDMAGKVPDTVYHAQYSGGQLTDHTAQLTMRKKQIAIGIPMDELMFSQFLDNFVHLKIMPWDELITTAGTYLPEARNSIHNIYLEKASGSHLLMLDSDVLPPPDFISKMLAHNKPMVGGWYNRKERYRVKDQNGVVSIIQRPVVYDFAREVDGKDKFIGRMLPGKGLERVDAAGAGCWLMRRDVAEAIGKSPYDMERSGEDMTLCRKVTKAGFEMFVDWDAPCAHAGVFFV